jgi:hypothetical protein
VKIALAVLLSAPALFAAVTYAALETGGVAIAETEMEDGTIRSTHVWFARKQNELWLEAGSATNGWFVDVQRTGELELKLGANPFRYKAEIHDKPAARKRVRRLLRQKYGWRDQWVALFVDQEGTIPVRLIAAGTGVVPQLKQSRKQAGEKTEKQAEKQTEQQTSK